MAMVKGIQRMQAEGVAIAHLKEYLRSLVKTVDVLRGELRKITPEQFQTPGEGEQEAAAAGGQDGPPTSEELVGGAGKSAVLKEMAVSGEGDGGGEGGDGGEGEGGAGGDGGGEKLGESEQAKEEESGGVDNGGQSDTANTEQLQCEEETVVAAQTQEQDSPMTGAGQEEVPGRKGGAGTEPRHETATVGVGEAGGQDGGEDGTSTSGDSEQRQLPEQSSGSVPSPASCDQT